MLAVTVGNLVMHCKVFTKSLCFAIKQSDCSFGFTLVELVRGSEVGERRANFVEAARI